MKPNKADMLRHVSHLFSEIDEGRIELAWSEAQGRNLSVGKTFAAKDITFLVESAYQKNSTPGVNVYIGAAVRKDGVATDGRCKDADFLNLTALYADIDDDLTKVATENCRSWNCQPTAVVVTGRRPHIRAQYWFRLNIPLADASLCRQYNTAIQLKLGGDPSVVNPGRILRLGGSVAWPKKAGREIELTEFHEFSDIRPKHYTLEIIDYAFSPKQLQLTEPLQNREQSPKSAQSSLIYSPDAQIPSTYSPQTPTLHLGNTPLSTDQMIAQIRLGDHWHDNMLRLVGNLVARGLSDTEILAFAESLTLPGYSKQDTCIEVGQMIKSGRQKWAKPNPLIGIEDDKPLEPIEPHFLDSLNLTMLPRRQFLLGTVLSRGQVSILVAAPGVGKTSLAIARAVALTCGRDITGEQVHEVVKTWVYGLEDDFDELRRRLGAVLQHFGIDFSEIRNRLALNSGVTRPLIVAVKGNDGVIIPTPDVPACIAHIRTNNIGAFIADPFVESHDLDENNNQAIKKAIGMFRLIAQSTKCAVLLPHHTAKHPKASSGSYAGDMNSARGASSAVGVARNVQTLFTMSNADAQELGVPDDEANLYLRLDDAKSNLSLSTGKAKWFVKKSAVIPNGDEVGVLAPHQFDISKAEVISLDTVRKILKLIEERWKSGNPFSEASNSPRCVVNAIQTFGLTKKQARGLLSDWIINGMVASEAVSTRDKSKGLRVLKWPG